MKTRLSYGLLVSLFLITMPAQPGIKPSPPMLTLKQCQALFRIVGRVVDYQGKRYPSVYPALRTPPGDTIAAFMLANHRRFEYLLQNKTQFTDLADWYPDTVRMNEVYAQRLGANKPFLTYVSQLLQPLKAPASTRKPIYQPDEMMLVASRFFLCDQVRPDTTVSWHICIGLNGMKEARWPRDYTLLEAFCFEAIFDRIMGKTADDARFMDQFLRAVDASTRKHKPLMITQEQLLEQVKGDVFQAMQSDPILQKQLLNYYQQHAGSLPFRIEGRRVP